MESISKIRIKGVDHPIDTAGLKLIWLLQTMYDDPYWEAQQSYSGHTYYRIPLTEEQYNLCKKAKIVSAYTNPSHDTYYEFEQWKTQLVVLGSIDSDYGDLSPSPDGEALIVAISKFYGDATYYLCASEEYYSSYIYPNIIGGPGWGTAFYFYG